MSGGASWGQHARSFFAVVLAVAAAVLLLGSARASHAQGPTTASAAGAQASASSDAGVGESIHGCVESVPKGAERPVVSDVFPPRGPSGWAATLSITVRHGKGERVLPSGLNLSSAASATTVLKQAGFIVPDQDGGAGAQIWTEPEDAQKANATTHLELPLVLLPSNPGRNLMKLPPLPVAVARANGELATVCTHEHTIVVDDPIVNTPDAMPRDNPPGLPQREEWSALKKALGWTALGLIAGALIALLVRWKLNQPKPLPPPPPPRPPWEVAFEELDEIRHAGLLERERYGEYFDRTSDTLRRYLGARFGFDGLESTTDEILAALKKQAAGFVRFESGGDAGPRRAFGPAPGISFVRIEGFLRECDLVKFANLTPTPQQCATSIESGEAIVRATMPTSVEGRFDDGDVPVDPVAAAQLRAPHVAPRSSEPAQSARPYDEYPTAHPPEGRTRVRSPYEPPDPDEARSADTAPEAHGASAPATAIETLDPPPRDPSEGGST